MRNSLIKLANRFALKYAHEQFQSTEGIDYTQLLLRIANDLNIAKYLKSRGVVNSLNYELTSWYEVDTSGIDTSKIDVNKIDISKIKDLITVNTFQVDFLSNPKYDYDADFVKSKFNIDVNDSGAFENFILECKNWINQYLMKNYSRSLQSMLNSEIKRNLNFKKDIEGTIFLVRDGNKELKTDIPLIQKRMGQIPVVIK